MKCPVRLIRPSSFVVGLCSIAAFFPWGTTAVTCTATGDSGNSSMCSFTVTVRPSFRRFTGTVH